MDIFGYPCRLMMPVHAEMGATKGTSFPSLREERPGICRLSKHFSKCHGPESLTTVVKSQSLPPTLSGPFPLLLSLFSVGKNLLLWFASLTVMEILLKWSGGTEVRGFTVFP